MRPVQIIGDNRRIGIVHGSGGLGNKKIVGEINMFINTVLGFEKRGETDGRFRDFPPRIDNRG